MNDFLRELKNRMYNPFFSSFLIAWIIINWRVSVAFIFYSNNTLKLDGYNSYVDLINKHYSTWNYYWYPFLIALGYTFIFPFFRNLVFGFQAWIKKWGGDWTLNISKEGKVPMKKFISLREDYRMQTGLLEKLYADESSIQQANDKLKTEIVALKTEKNALSADLQSWKLNNEEGLLNGEWQLVTRSPLDNVEVIARVRIKNKTANIFNESPNEKGQNMMVTDFFYNPIQQRLCLVWRQNNIESEIIQLLTPNTGFTEMHGMQYFAFNKTDVFNKAVNVSYKKIKDI